MRFRSVVAIVLGLALIALSSPVAPGAPAQQKLWRIGWLTPASPADSTLNLRNFREQLGELGYVENRNYVIEARFAATDRSRLPGLAKELVDSGVDIIVTIGTPTVRAAKNATSTIPIVMAGSENPVENGLVVSLAHPGGNVTGVTHNPGPGFFSKCLELLKEIAPTISRVAVLSESGYEDPKTEARENDERQAAARELQIAVLYHDAKGVQSAEDFGVILSAISEERADALFVVPTFVNDKYGQAILDFATTHRLPSMFQDTWFVEHGGLLTYYTDWGSLRRRAAVYVDKILKGAKPADLPVEQPTKFQLVINRKTATALGLTIPASMLALADEVID